MCLGHRFDEMGVLAIMLKCGVVVCANHFYDMSTWGGKSQNTMANAHMPNSEIARVLQRSLARKPFSIQASTVYTKKKFYIRTLYTPCSE